MSTFSFSLLAGRPGIVLIRPLHGDAGKRLQPSHGRLTERRLKGPSGGKDVVVCKIHSMDCRSSPASRHVHVLYGAIARARVACENEHERNMEWRKSRSNSARTTPLRA